MDSSHERTGTASSGLQYLSEDDVFIAIMGMTGTGKSTFIAKCVPNTALKIGHNLESYTRGVTISSMRRGGRNVHLIDTPGFDDTHRSDAEILQELSYWLIKSYELNLRISGVVYLHRITDLRLSGSALRGLHVFKEICGPRNFPLLTMATTRWDEVSRSEGVFRERLLTNNAAFWGDIVAGGGSVTRIEPGQHSALAIVDRIVQRNQKMALRLQQELVDKGISLGETRSGKMVHAAILADLRRDASEMAALRSEMNVTIASQQEQSRRKYQQIMRKYDAKIEKGRLALSVLQRTSSELQKHWEPRLMEEYGRLKQRLKTNEEFLRRLEYDRRQSSLGSARWDQQYGQLLRETWEEGQDLKRAEGSHLGGKLVQEAMGGLVSGVIGVAVTAAFGAVACNVM